MLLWLLVVSLVRILPLCSAVPFLLPDDGGYGGDGSSGGRAEIAGMQIVSMSEVSAKYFFVINEYKGDEITRQSCCMTDLETPRSFQDREVRNSTKGLIISLSSVGELASFLCGLYLLLLAIRSPVWKRHNIL